MITFKGSLEEFKEWLNKDGGSTFQPCYFEPEEPKEEEETD